MLKKWFDLVRSAVSGRVLMLASGIALIIVLIVLVVIATGNSRGDKLSGQELIDLPLAYKKDVRPG